MKKIFKKIAVAIAMFAIAGTAFGASLASPTGIPVMNVWSGSSYGTTKNVYAGDDIIFEIHTYANQCTANGVRNQMEYLHNKTFSTGTSKNVWGKISANGLPTMTGTVRLNFKDNVKLEYVGYKWFVKQEGQNPGPDTRKYITGNQHGSYVIQSGVDLGTLTYDQRSNYLVKFKAVANGSSAVNGQCSGIVNKCVSGTFTDLSDTSTQYKWRCNGIDGGSSIVCSKNKPAQPVDGGWSNWTITNNGTYGSCINGTKTKTVSYSRTCSNPYPANGGSYCSGNSTKTEQVTASCTAAATLEIQTKVIVENSVNVAKLKGRVLSDDASAVWFALSRNSNPSCSNTAQRVGYAGAKSENLYFYANVNNLSEDTRYYYRACGEDNNGNVKSGDILSFKTDKRNIIIPAEVLTNAPTNIGINVATLNGRVTVNGTVNPRVYFIYGTSSSNMNARTSKLYVNQDTYFQAIQGLRPNTRYYYQAIVENSAGIVDRGIIRNFVTRENVTTVNTSATTSYAKPSYTVATLYGRVNGGDGLVRCYFNYGRTASLGLKSTSYLINSDSTKSCSRVIRGLTPGKRYYYQTVIEDNGVRYTGVIKSFVQKRRGVVNPQPTVAVTPTVEVTPVSDVTVTLESEVIEGVNLMVNKEVSLNRESGYSLVVNAAIGDTVFYKVRVVNNTDETMENIEVTDTIPAGLVLSGGSNYNGNDKFITSKIGSLASGQSKVFITEMTVSNMLSAGDVVDSKADVRFDGKEGVTNSVAINIIEKEVIAASANNNNQTASIFGSNSGFLPNTLLGWLGLITFVMLIAFLISKLFSAENNTRATLAELRAIEAAKMRR